MANASNSKKHHYIPQYYLKGFTESPTSSKIWVYEKDTGKTFRANTINVAHENYFYAFNLPDGTRDSNTYESWLANSIEGPANSVIEKIRRNELMTDEDKRTLSIYIGIMHKRVPTHREEIRKLVPQVMGNLAHEINSESIPELPTQRHKEIALAILKEYETEIPNHFLLPSLSLKVASAFYSMTWAFFSIDANVGFLTNDNPVFFDKGIGIAHQHSEVTFPISKSVALWATWRTDVEEKFMPANRAVVAEINRRTVTFASRHIFYHRKVQWVSDLIAKRRHKLNRII